MNIAYPLFFKSTICQHPSQHCHNFKAVNKYIISPSGGIVDILLNKKLPS